MSQKATRAAASVDEKPQTSPVQDMKKKMAANAEKLAMEKNGDKTADKKTVEKQNGDKKVDKPAEKQNGDKKVPEKVAEKKPADKPTEKKVEKSVEKKEEKPVEKKVEKTLEKKAEVEKKDDNKAQASKPDQKPDDKQKKSEKDKPKQNGKPMHNGVTDVTLASNGGPDEVLNGSTSKETKVLKLKDDAPERKLRSTDSPKKTERVLETPKKQDGGQENGGSIDVVVVIEDCEEATRKPDTNFSKSRVKVSPYRRSGRIADQTTSSMVANYTGNNTTMEMDITNSSATSETPAEEGSYIQTLRSIRGRRSYKPYVEIKLTPRANRSLTHTSADSTRPTLPVVGRKRKPDTEPEREHEPEHEHEHELSAAEPEPEPHVAKRSRLLQRVMSPFRRATVPSSTPLPARRSAQIVGINSDLPMSAPVAADPEIIKMAAPALERDSAVPTLLAGDRDSKRCVVM